MARPGQKIARPRQIYLATSRPLLSIDHVVKSAVVQRYTFAVTLGYACLQAVDNFGVPV